MNQRTRAVVYLRRSLEQQPYLWSAYEALCTLGEDVDAKEFFHVSMAHPCWPVLDDATLRVLPTSSEAILYTPRIKMTLPANQVYLHD